MVSLLLFAMDANWSAGIERTDATLDPKFTEFVTTWKRRDGSFAGSTSRKSVRYSFVVNGKTYQGHESISELPTPSMPVYYQRDSPNLNSLSREDFWTWYRPAKWVLLGLAICGGIFTFEMIKLAFRQSKELANT